jgi:hypothetical protein
MAEVNAQEARGHATELLKQNFRLDVSSLTKEQLNAVVTLLVVLSRQPELRKRIGEFVAGLTDPGAMIDAANLLRYVEKFSR